MKVKLSNKEIEDLLDIEISEFPKYVSNLLNLANRFAQGTRPRVVGQMTELIKEFEGESFEQWKEWYSERYPDAISKATDRIHNMIRNFKSAIDKIDREMIEKWVNDLTIIKTFIGLRFQEAILIKGAELMKTSYRHSSPEEESKGIDGYIGDIPVSIKPDTYKIKDDFTEEIRAKIIYYKKTKTGIEVDYGELR